MCVVKASIGVSSESDELRNIVDLSSSMKNALYRPKGGVYQSKAGMSVAHPWSVWRIDSSESVDSALMEDHIQYIRTQCDALESVLVDYADRGDINVSLSMWFEVDELYGGFVVGSTVMASLVRMVNRVDVRFIGGEGVAREEIFPPGWKEGRRFRTLIVKCPESYLDGCEMFPWSEYSHYEAAKPVPADSSGLRVEIVWDSFAKGSFVGVDEFCLIQLARSEELDRIDSNGGDIGVGLSLWFDCGDCIGGISLNSHEVQTMLGRVDFIHFGFIGGDRDE